MLLCSVFGICLFRIFLIKDKVLFRFSIDVFYINIVESWFWFVSIWFLIICLCDVYMLRWFNRVKLFVFVLLWTRTVEIRFAWADIREFRRRVIVEVVNAMEFILLFRFELGWWIFAVSVTYVCYKG